MIPNVKSRYAVFCVSVVLLLTSQAAFALWSLEVENQSVIPVTVARPVPAGASLKDLGVLGDGAVVIPGRGVVQFVDIAHRDNPCQRPHWGVQIQYKGEIMRFYYDGNGRLGVTIDSEGEPSFHALSGGSQIIEGTNPPHCH